jgi:ketosteroid isomerase-like protein
MIIRILTFVLLTGFLTITSATIGQQESARIVNRRALVEMERSFAKAAATNGTRAAFLEFLAEDGIIFQPGPVNGKQVWNARPNRKGLLSWEPVFADVSSAGDLGYTTGPWEFRPNGPEDKPAAFGQYFTIWKKQSDGSWKAALDRGVTNTKPSEAAELQFPKDDGNSRDQTKIDPRNRAVISHPAGVRILKLLRRKGNR